MDEFKKQFINDPTDLICRNKKFIKRQQKRQNQTESQTESPNRNNMSTEVDEDFMVASCSHKSTSTIMPIDSLQLINDKTKPNENHHLLHQGLDCSTLSNPPNLMIDNCFHIIGGYSPDQSSVTSSGVAMSSNDNLSTDLSINMNSAIENTPSTTLTDAHSSTELQSEFQQAATTNLSNDLTCSNALSSLSLNTRHCVTSTIKSERMNNTSTSNTFAYSSHIQAQSTPSLLWDEKRNSSSTDYKIKQQLTSSNVSTQTSFKKNVDIIESKVNHSANKRHDEKSVTTILTSTAPNLMVGSSTNPHYTISPPSSSHNSILGTSPLPSVFNCAATSCSQIFCTPLRTIVSQNRRRYQMDGFNLDLTYITDRIIAMGYPADTKEALYRNSMSHIVKFLEHYHPGHYKVFNLRGQYIYDPANFHNRVVSFEMTDHHPPRLELMAPFCREVHDYLNADPLNIVAVHCKAGKGRTGVMICAYLCYIAFYRTPRQNMDYYSIIRTHNNKGVTIPSQRRYVYYFAHLRQRNLNYMPLRCELVGIYLERPPKLSGTFSKGALKVRVACGDVDVFLGDDMWLNSEQYDEEEELHKRFPLTSNDDQYNPIHPETTKNCISRRCFGWTVPPNKRVFLEGDIRVDIFQKSRLKLFNVKQERKKIGHIWFNTMFTCPGFCGGPYIHGDEAFPYPESMIVRRHFRRKKREIRKESDCHMENFQQQKNEQLNTRRFSPSHPASAPTIAQDYISINEGTFDKVDLMHFKDAYISEALKKPSPSRSLIEAEKKGWQSQDGDTSQKLTTEIPPIKKQCRSSLDTPENEFEEEIVVDKPPGLDKHCPSTSLQAIYPNERSAPRYGVEELIREAFEKNLINDLYNTRRMSQPRDGPTIPKAIVGRPNANGPNCLIRNKDEHVGIFGVQEIDRAYKNKDIDSAFKVFILTRCIDESIPGDIRLCEQFIHVTLQKQEQKDLQKLEKLQQKQRKMMSGQQQSFKAQQTILNTTETTLEVGEGGLSKLGEMSQNINDPRITDPHYGKYFFRQRVTSHSKHPNVHHHCPLINIDVKICQQYGCLEMKNKNTLESNSAKNRTNLIIPKGTVRSNEELKSRFDLEDSNYAFDDFDFFHPRQETCSTIHGISKNDKVNSSLLHNENVVKKQRNEEMDVILASSSADDIPMIDKQILEIDDDPPIKIIPKSKQMVSLTNTLLSSESNEPEVFHPSDCSLAPSTSSSCSSSDQSD